jgi:hypothetical protein
MKSKQIAGILIGLVATGVGIVINGPVGWFVIIAGIGVGAMLAAQGDADINLS